MCPVIVSDPKILFFAGITGTETEAISLSLSPNDIEYWFLRIVSLFLIGKLWNDERTCPLEPLSRGLFNPIGIVCFMGLLGSLVIKQVL